MSLESNYTIHLITDPDKTGCSEYIISELNINKDDYRLITRETLSVGSSYRFVKIVANNLKINGDEFSDLVMYNGKLLTCCDKTGIVFSIDVNRAVNVEGFCNRFIRAKPEYIICKEDGNPMKLEWMCTFKNNNAQHLLMGGHGLRDDSMMFLMNEESNCIKTLYKYLFYQNIKKILGVKNTGYVTHEAIVFSDAGDTIIIAPRKISKLFPYTAEVDAVNGCGKVIIVPKKMMNDEEDGELIQEIILEDFISKNEDDAVSYEWGFSSIQQLGSNHLIGIQTIEKGSCIRSRIVLFDMNGKMLGNNRNADGFNVLFEWENKKIEGMFVVSS